MTNRVVLGAFDGTYALRVSRPGSNVLTTTLPTEQLAFDSRWAAAGNVLAQGSVPCRYQLGDLYAAWFAEINGPMGLSRPPIVFAQFRHETITNAFTSIQGFNLGFFQAAYDLATGKVTIHGSLPWKPPGSGTNVDIMWGYCSYFLLRP